MSRFAIRTPYFIVVVCLIIAVVGATSLKRTESSPPLAQAVLGGMSVSLAMTVIMVQAAYYVAYRKDDLQPPGGPLGV